MQKMKMLHIEEMKGIWCSLYYDFFGKSFSFWLCFMAETKGSYSWRQARGLRMQVIFILFYLFDYLYLTSLGLLHDTLIFFLYKSCLYRDLERKIVEAEMEITLAKSQGFLKNQLKLPGSSSNKKLLAVIGVYTGFGSLLNRNVFRGSWMPKGNFIV